MGPVKFDLLICLEKRADPKLLHALKRAGRCEIMRQQAVAHATVSTYGDAKAYMPIYITYTEVDVAETSQ